MNETDYIRKFMKAWKTTEPMLWWHKIADPAIAGWMSNPRSVDVVACLDGKLIGMEWKLHKSNRQFPTDAVRHSQVLALLDIHKAGGCALLAIGRYTKRDDKMVYLIPIVEWVKRCRLANDPNDIEPPLKSINLHNVLSEFEFHPWDFKWLKHNIKKGSLIDIGAPTSERIRKLYGKSGSKN